MSRMDDYNYYNDRRVSVGATGQRGRVSEDKRLISFDLYDSEADEGFEHSFPVHFVSCDLCDGQGSYVNPAVDAGGISGDVFRDDPEFYEEYRNGMYNITCRECRGKGIRAEPDKSKFDATDKRSYEILQESWREDAEFEAECRAERAMGC